jgi:hypothetical protein
MGYPKDTFRFGCMASLYMQNAIESFIETKEIFHWIKTNKEEYPQYTEENLARKASVVIVFRALTLRARVPALNGCSREETSEGGEG